MSSRAHVNARRVRKAVALVPVLAATVALAACGSAGGSGDDAGTVRGQWGATINTGGTPRHGGTLRIDQQSAPEGISSLFYVRQSTNSGGQVVEQMFDQLVEYQPGSLDPVPGLAKSWEISDDAKTYTFHLRRAQFSNGMPVTSADVKFSLNYTRRPDSAYVDLFNVISSIETPDDSTVVVKLSKPSRAFIYYTAYIAASIVPARLVQSEGIDAYNDHPIGSGPFVLTRWKRNQEVDLARNDKYWRKPLPYLDAVRLVVTPSDNTRSLNVQSGTSDVADQAPFSQIKTIDASGKAKVLVAPGSDMYIVWLNNSRKPLDETPVRRALAYATPVDSIVRVAFAGIAPKMNTIIPKLKYWTDEAKAYPYDLEKARAELAKSTVPDGFDISIIIVSGGNDQASTQVAQILQSSWAKIGVKLKIRPVDGATQGDEFGSGKYQITLIAPGAVTSDVPVDDEFAQLVLNSPSTHNLYTWSRDPEVSRLVSEAIVEPSETKRVELFKQIHIKSMEHAPVIPLVYTPNRAAVSNSVHNFSYLLGGLWPLDRVWID